MKVFRKTYDGPKQWLRVTEKVDIKVIKEEKFSEHGSLTRGSGNGHHGNCTNCGLALVTDLGYNSWEDTKCEIKKETIKNITYKLTWQKLKDRATELSKDKATKHFHDLIHNQGWGTYNFGTDEYEI